MSLAAKFLSQTRDLVRTRNGEQLRVWMQVLPQAPPQYHDLATELRSQFPQQRGDDATDAKVEALVEKGLAEEHDVAEGMATSWPGLVTFVKDYLLFWRDIDYEDLQGAHTLLCGLVNSCSTAFAHPTYGGMLLQTSMSLSEALVQLTMMLNKRPDLMKRLWVGDADDRKSVAEMSAEIIQKIFTTCLTDRTSARQSKPEGKKVGVYMFANLVLKLLFACGKTHLSGRLFTNVSTNSPPLSLYPAAQRVTFLYYLGRFNLANNHYLRAADCLEEAYLETPPQLTSHRTLILTYLIPSNLLLSRLPSQLLLQRPETQSLAPIFQPIAHAIRTGNFILFQQSLAKHESWLFNKGLLLVLTHRLRPFLWRSLSRKVFLLTYQRPADANNDRKAALLDLAHLHAAANYIQHRLEGYIPSPRPHKPARTAGISPMLTRAIHRSAAAAAATAADPDSTLQPPPGGPKKLWPNEGLIWGNAEVRALDIEMTMASLIHQGLLHGYLAHGPGKFAIMGGKAKNSPVTAGWPNVWAAIMDRKYEEDVDIDQVPGWVKA